MMPVPWKLWEGQVVDLCFPLRRYLGGTDRSAVYLTQYGDPEPCHAAIKLVLAESREADPAAQWERAAQLSHPHLLRLLRTGTWQVNRLALRYAVTEYAEENLAEVLAERPLTPAEVREMLQPLLEALAYIHSEGLVHGHVKPANIMAVGDELKLSVDGISLVGEPGSAPAIPGPYDPPELRERGCSPVGDVWSFGATLVEALTQQLPVSRGPKLEPVLPATLPAEFLPIVRACLRPDPRRRAPLNGILELFGQAMPLSVEEPVEELAPEQPPATGRKWLSLAIVGASAVALAGMLAGPRLFRHPVASAQAEQQVSAPTVPAIVPIVQTPPPVEPAPAAKVADAPAPAPAASTPAAEPTAPAPHKKERAVEAMSGQVVHQVLPEVPDYARRTIRGMVKIQIRTVVDASGHVTDATVESQNSRYFAKLALDASRQWQFVSGAGEWLLRFEFTTAGATVHPSRVTR
jgi:serine/threonine-protein kinase Stk1